MTAVFAIYRTQSRLLRRRQGCSYWIGEDGTFSYELDSDYNTREIRLNGQVLNDIPEIPQTITRSPGHQQNFIDSVKSRQQPESKLEYARQMTLPMHLAMISYKLQKPLKWDSKKELFKKDAGANDLLWRPYREKWNLIGA